MHAVLVKVYGGLGPLSLRRRSGEGYGVAPRASGMMGTHGSRELCGRRGWVGLYQDACVIVLVMPMDGGEQLAAGKTGWPQVQRTF